MSGIDSSLRREEVAPDAAVEALLVTYTLTTTIRPGWSEAYCARLATLLYVNSAITPQSRTRLQAIYDNPLRFKFSENG